MSTIAPTQPMSAAPPAGLPVPALALSELYRFTVDQYERMVDAGILTDDDRVELIDGYVVTKMGKKPPHVWTVDSLEDLLRALLGGKWCLRGESPANIPPFDEPEPDIVIARGTRATYLERHPDPVDIGLIAEVSDTIYHRDRGKKWEANARSGIPVYWIVNLTRRRVEVYTDPTPEGYGSRREYHAGESILVVLDGEQIGRVAVNDILPPAPAVPPAESNGV
jgi:Uma2 family endonuclease